MQGLLEASFSNDQKTDCTGWHQRQLGKKFIYFNLKYCLIRECLMYPKNLAIFVMVLITIIFFFCRGAKHKSLLSVYF